MHARQNAGILRGTVKNQVTASHALLEEPSVYIRYVPHLWMSSDNTEKDVVNGSGRLSEIHVPYSSGWVRPTLPTYCNCWNCTAQLPMKVGSASAPPVPRHFTMVPPNGLNHVVLFSHSFGRD